MADHMAEGGVALTEKQEVAVPLGGFSGTQALLTKVFPTLLC